MLSSFRTAMTKGPAKIVTALVMFLLSSSFAIWGIEDVFRGGGSNNVATVGSASISVDAFTDAYRQRASQITQATGKAVTPDIARTFGIDKQVLNSLVADTALDVQATKLGLGLDPKAMVQAVMNDPTFQTNVPGQPPAFDPVAFRQLLQNNGLNEESFFVRQRAVYIRGQMDQAFAEGGPVSDTLQQAVARFSQEKRNISYFVLPQSAVGDITPPDAAALQSYYDENKGAFRTPEYRTMTYVLVSPADLAARANVSDADIEAIFDKRKDSYGKPEKREIEQIAFPSLDEAKAAATRLASGQITFDALATERKLKPEDVNLGTLVKSQLTDPKIADAAFALKEGATSDAIQGGLANVILKVSKIEPAVTATLDSAKDEIKQALIAQRSSEVLKNLRDTFDDERMGGTALKDIAAKLKLQAVSVPPINKQGFDQVGKPVDLPLQAQVLPALFTTEQGADPDTIDGREAGLMWFSLDNVIASQDRSLDQAKADVITAWTADERVKRLKTKADDLVKAMNGGKTLEDSAKELNAQIVPAWDIVRNGQNPPVPPATVTSIFATPLKAFGSSLAANGTDRLIFHVEDNVIPEFDPKAAANVATAKQLAGSIGQDLMIEYVKQIQNDLGVSINQTNVDRVVGTGSL